MPFTTRCTSIPQTQRLTVFQLFVDMYIPWSSGRILGNLCRYVSLYIISNCPNNCFFQRVESGKIAYKCLAIILAMFDTSWLHEVFFNASGWDCIRRKNGLAIFLLVFLLFWLCIHSCHSWHSQLDSCHTSWTIKLHGMLLKPREHRGDDNDATIAGVTDCISAEALFPIFC